MNIDLLQLQQLVRDVVKSTLLPQFHQVKRQYKPDGSIVTATDMLMQQRLTEALAQAYPDIALLGEEMSVEQQQTLLDKGDALWCLDPIDGTSNFAAGMPYFSVSLALLNQGQVDFGLVYDPIMDECFTAKRGEGAWLNDELLQAQPSGLELSQTIALVDFKRLSKNMSRTLLDDRPFGSQRNLGSIALELCWIAVGRAHIYLHGSQNLWDYAAAQLIITEAGAYVSALDGSPLFSNTLEKRSACAAIDHALFSAWQQYLADIA